MSTRFVVTATAAAAALGAVVWYFRKAKPAETGKVAAAVVPALEQRPGGVVAVQPVPPAQAGAPAPPAPVGSNAATNAAGELAARLAREAAKKALGTSAATVVAGIQVADGIRQVMTKVGGEGVGNTSALFAPAAVGLAVKRGAEELGAKLGVPSDFNRRIAQTVGVAAADPTGIVTAAKVTAEVASLGLRAVAGEKVERQVRDVVKQFDPTNHRNVTHAPIAAVARGVSAVANIFKGGLFGRR